MSLVNYSSSSDDNDDIVQTVDDKPSIKTAVILKLFVL